MAKDSNRAAVRPVPALLRADADLYEKKAGDYAPKIEDPWENFKFAAHFAARVCLDLAAHDPRRATVTILGVKLSRLMTLGLAGAARNEAVEDTLKDLRVYAAILEAQNL